MPGEAAVKPVPKYPRRAKLLRVGGKVVVKIIIDEDGGVIEAEAVSGPRLLRGAAVESARKAWFTPTSVSGHPVKVTGTITYDFKLIFD
jgi:protein TonB